MKFHCDLKPKLSHGTVFGDETDLCIGKADLRYRLRWFDFEAVLLRQEIEDILIKVRIQPANETNGLSYGERLFCRCRMPA